MFRRIALAEDRRAYAALAGSLTYEGYVAMLDGMASGRSASQVVTAGLFEDLASKGLKGTLLKFFSHLKRELVVIIGKLNVTLNDMIVALQSRNVYGFLMAIKLDLPSLGRSVLDAAGLIEDGLIYVMEDILKSGVMDKVRKKTMTVDEVLAKYPKLKHLSGPPLAGLLFWVWLNSLMLGKFKVDFDWDLIVHAMTGKFSLTEMLTTEKGVMFFSLCGLHLAGVAIEFEWLGAETNIVVALAYVGLKTVGGAKNSEAMHKLLAGIKFTHVKA